MRKTHILVIGISFLLLACSSPMDKKFKEETAKVDIEAIKSKLDSTEMGLLVGTMVRLKFQDKNLEDMTYAEILADGKKWKIEQEKIEITQSV